MEDIQKELYKHYEIKFKPVELGTEFHEEVTPAISDIFAKLQDSKGWTAHSIQTVLTNEKEKLEISFREKKDVHSFKACLKEF
ncbi:MAG: hypothetical protein H7A23_00725 [Leptospiraceae bacterium]|nr:hypothetical protein [Leptospiraceae bacterium]MCP5493054.1 hypothetical protein [Leptospiraceae bacterium]